MLLDFELNLEHYFEKAFANLLSENRFAFFGQTLVHSEQKDVIKKKKVLGCCSLIFGPFL